MGSCLFNCSIGCNGDGDGAASTRLTRMYWLQGCPFGAFNIGSSHMNVEPHVNRSARFFFEAQRAAGGNVSTSNFETEDPDFSTDVSR